MRWSKYEVNKYRRIRKKVNIKKDAVRCSNIDHIT